MFAVAPVAIIDIGSNSVRLVVYSSASRIPSVIFNEKVMAGLGVGVAETGMLSEASQERALGALRRFAALVAQIGADTIRTVATAAVRDASNGAEFLDEVRAIGLKPEILSGDEESRMAGLGVLSAIPDADGIAGDLGGGSLELVDLRDGQIGRRVSLPFGVLRLGKLSGRNGARFTKVIGDAVEQAGLTGAARGRQFYLVGGSWRSLARVEMILAGHPLPIPHQHVLAIDRPRRLKRELEELDKETLRRIALVSASRAPLLPIANQFLDALVAALTPEALIVSSFGIREGLLYQALSAEERRLDPLIEAARAVGAGLGRFAQHGDLLDGWIAGIFDDPPATSRLRLATCLLADIAWAAHPDFRAERGIDMALHGNWVAIDAAGRVMIAQALFSSFGGGGELPYPEVARLCSAAQLEKARSWGLAIRLGQRLSGGVATGLETSRLCREGGELGLELRGSALSLAGESVERRLKVLANLLGLKPRMQSASGASGRKPGKT